jgi:DNA repair exonuclease SbcCD ATPase subunit
MSRSNERTNTRNEHEQNLATLKSEYSLKLSQMSEKIDLEKEKLSQLTLEVNQIEEAKRELNNISHEIKNKRDAITSQNQRAGEIKSKLAFIEEKLSHIEELKLKLSEINKNIVQLEKDIVEYNFLARAFDKTGIPVLKLENSAIEITTIANELLGFFDNDCRIVFETTKLTKDKTKFKEVFDINVIDQEGSIELKNKSGGENVWIETSIQQALGIFLRSQGRDLSTGFLDEQDGALDLDNAYNYRMMIENSHMRSGVYHTIIITHRPEIINLMDQKIILSDEGINLLVA